MATAELICPIYTDVPLSLQSSNCSPDELQNERFLTEHIVDLWETRQCYQNAIRGEKAGIRSIDRSLGQMLYLLKPILARPGRSGG
jgi:hypothetical protein